MCTGVVDQSYDQKSGDMMQSKSSKTLLCKMDVTQIP